MKLDPETFATEPGGIRWRFMTTRRLGQFDIATTSGDDWGPEPEALANLERALDRLDELYDEAVAAAQREWTATYRAPWRPEADWTLVRIFADQTGLLVLTVHEGDYDTYGKYEVSFVRGVVTDVVRQPF